MSLKDAIRSSHPTSYWPLDDPASANSVRDEMGLHDGSLPAAGVRLAAVPFGATKMPSFDGERNSVIRIPSDVHYSHPCAGVLSVACWICPLSLNFRHTSGSRPDEQFVHFLEKAVNYNTNVEWSMRLLNANSRKPSRLSFYFFNCGKPAGLGAGAYMQHGLSTNDATPVEIGRWLFLVGQGEAWIDKQDQSTGAIVYKQAIQARRTPGDKYNNPPQWNVQPHHSDGEIAIGGSIDKTAFHGSVAHVALWNRLLSTDEIQQIYQAGRAELAQSPTP